MYHMDKYIMLQIFSHCKCGWLDTFSPISVWWLYVPQETVCAHNLDFLGFKPALP